MFQNRYGNRLIRLITKIGFRLLTDNQFQNFSDYTTLGPTDLNINSGHLLIKDYLPTKFEASGAKRS